MDLVGPISELEIGDHACLLYEDSYEALRVAAEFLKIGLDRDEPAMYVVSDHPIERVIAEMERAGIDVALETKRGTLAFLNAREYCPLDHFEPQRMIDRLRDMGEQMSAIGIPAARLVAEMTWTVDCGVTHEQLIEYESHGNHLFDDFSGSAICMYNRRQFPPSVVDAIVRAHPVVIVNGRMIRNPFYEPPEIFFENNPERRLDWMLQQLNSL
jgi:hypothetical protein